MKGTLQEILLCPTCKSSMVLRTTRKFTYGNGQNRRFFGCSKYPDCKETHGASPDGKPLGIPVDARTRRLRRSMHVILNRAWDWNSKKDKRSMYKWMSAHFKKKHIGEMTETELRYALEVIASDKMIRKLMTKKDIQKYQDEEDLRNYETNEERNY